LQRPLWIWWIQVITMSAQQIIGHRPGTRRSYDTRVRIFPTLVAG